MTSHKLFRLGRASVGFSALTAPVPLITCALDGRAGATALLPFVPMVAGIVLLASHGTNAANCDGCMGEVVNALASAPGLRPIDLDEQADAFDLDEVA